MTPEIEKLLAVLDMTEEEQYCWVMNNFPDEGWKPFPDDEDDSCIRIAKSQYSRITADLAFKMRDEAVKTKAYKYAQRLVWERTEYKNAQPFKPMNPQVWWLDMSQPIHWIIAALIAQEQSK